MSPAHELAHAPIAAVMIPVGDLTAGLAWYRRAFPTARLAGPPGVRHGLLQFDAPGGRLQIDLVLADEHHRPGAAGTVVYWQVPDLDTAIRHMGARGAKLARGPVRCGEPGMGSCQMQDPWGNRIGLRGPWTPPALPPS